jgi:hypothetical protein
LVTLSTSLWMKAEGLGTYSPVFDVMSPTVIMIHHQNKAGAFDEPRSPRTHVPLSSALGIGV